VTNKEETPARGWELRGRAGSSPQIGKGQILQCLGHCPEECDTYF
jgi:hypothetical protein